MHACMYVSSSSYDMHVSSFTDIANWSSSFSNWRPLASGLPQESSWMWTVPESVEQGVYLLRLREMGGPRLASPQYPVTVRDKFEFVCPGPSDSYLAWEVRGTQTIQWRSFGAVDKAQVCVCVCVCVRACVCAYLRLQRTNSSLVRHAHRHTHTTHTHTHTHTHCPWTLQWQLRYIVLVF